MKSSMILAQLLLLASQVQAGPLEKVWALFDRAPLATEVYQEVTCNATTETENATIDNTCNVAPFSGHFVCRKYFSWFLWESYHSVCVRDITENTTMALKEDTCGCCDGVCQEECPCQCGDIDEETGEYSSVYVQPIIAGGPRGGPRCVRKNWAKHMTNWGGGVVCADNCGAGGGSEVEVEDLEEEEVGMVPYDDDNTTTFLDTVLSWLP